MTTADAEQTLRPAIWAAVDAWGEFIAHTGADHGAYEHQRNREPDTPLQAQFDTAVRQVEQAAQELGGWLWDPDVDRIRAAAYLRHLSDSRARLAAPFEVDEPSTNEHAVRAGRVVRDVITNVERACAGWEPHPLDDHHTREWRRLEVDELAVYAHPAHQQAVVEALAARRTWAAPLAHLRTCLIGDRPLSGQDVAYLGDRDSHKSLPKRLLAAAQAGAAADRDAQAALSALGLHFTVGTRLLGLPYDPACQLLDEAVVGELLSTTDRPRSAHRPAVGSDRQARRHR